MKCNRASGLLDDDTGKIKALLDYQLTVEGYKDRAPFTVRL